MNIQDNTGSIGRSQNLPFAIDADIVKPEKGFLNGSTVTIQEIDQDKFVGIQVTTEQFAELPKNTQPVKVAFKDFRKLLSKCRPVKALENMLSGKGKGVVEKQSWEVISNAQAERVLKATRDAEKKEKLAGDMENFNLELRLLNGKKDNFIKSKIINDEFKEKYKTILAIADGDLKSLRKGLIIVLPPATKDGNPQYVRLTSKSSKDRINDANKLVDILKNNEAYKQYRESVESVNKLEDECKQLKTSLAKQAENLKKTHEELINEKAEGDKEMLVDRHLELKEQTSREMLLAASDYVDKMNGIIDAKISTSNHLRKKIIANLSRIDDIQDEIGRLLDQVQSCETDDLTLSDDTSVVMDKDDTAQTSKNKEMLLQEIESKRKYLELLDERLKEDKAAFKETVQRIEALEAEKLEELVALEEERYKVVKQFDDFALKLSTWVDPSIKTEQQAVARMLSDSGSSEKVSARTASNQSNR